MSSIGKPHNNPPTMRKIETQMCKAVQNSMNWKSANTSVHFNEENNVSVVRLHGNKIAEVGDDYMTIFDGGFQSNTTKSRLNALINEFCNAVTDGIFQKNYQWYVSDNKAIKSFTGEYTLFDCYHPFKPRSSSNLSIHENCSSDCCWCSSLEQ